MRIFVLLFNANTDNEGIHSIQMGNRQKILAFKVEDDAIRFAVMLEAQDFPTPTVEAIDLEEIQEICQKANYDLEVVEEGMLAVPPETNLDETDWEKDNKQKDVEAQSETPTTDLDKIRRQLEGLL